MDTYYLAVDIGASSGRHILGHFENGRLVCEEVYRFSNGMVKKDGSYCWDTAALFSEIKNGLKKCREINKIPKFMGIDTWGVDYVLLDDKDNVIDKAYAYRDSRTNGMTDEVFSLVPEKTLYEKTGIITQTYNTVYQLMSVKKKNPGHLKAARAFLMIPEYFNFLLTGKKVSEYTNASTSQLVNAKTNDWDAEILDTLGFPKEIFTKPQMPGTNIGGFSEAVMAEIGFDCEVVLPPTHDTASAIMAVPDNSDTCLYISSGTWSLMGIESKLPTTTAESMQAGFTNEGGFAHRYCYLKNIMGLWMIQSVRHEFGDKYSFAQLCSMAEEEKDFASEVDVNDACFLAPENMCEAIKDYCNRTSQPVPQNVGQIATVIYKSLAKCYAKTTEDLEKISGKTYDCIHIVGGGSNADYLNILTAKHSGKSVLAGPSEATAIGNLLTQIIADGKFSDLTEARKCVYNSFDVKEWK